MGNRTQQIAGIDKNDIMNRRTADNYWKKEELKLPDHYRMISAGAFQDNIRIERLLLGNKMEVLGKDSFRHCIALKEARLSHSVERMGEGCFADCPRLREAYMSQNLHAIPNSAFREDRRLEKILFTKNCKVEWIGKDAFSECVLLPGILLPPKVTVIGDGFLALRRN